MLGLPFFDVAGVSDNGFINEIERDSGIKAIQQEYVLFSRG